LRERYPELHRFEDDWGIELLVKAHLTKKKAYQRKYLSQGKKPAARGRATNHATLTDGEVIEEVPAAEEEVLVGENIVSEDATPYPEDATPSPEDATPFTEEAEEDSMMDPFRGLPFLCAQPYTTFDLALYEECYKNNISSRFVLSHG
jgi:hypothetical protein